MHLSSNFIVRLGHEERSPATTRRRGRDVGRADHASRYYDVLEYRENGRGLLIVLEYRELSRGPGE
jgi:hypothetical protein